MSSLTNPTSSLFDAREIGPSDLRKAIDRRRNSRVSVLIPVRLRPARFDDGNFEDTTTTTNVSRGCMSVTTWRDSYRAGMNVLVTYPYIPSGKSMGFEYLAEILRVNELPDGRFRVVVKLQFVMQSSPRPRLISL